jgi:hypothetical protein
MLVVLALPALGQEEAILGTPRDEVIRFLALTSDQVATWNALIATRERTVPLLRDQLKRIEEQIRGLLAQPSPDPATVGGLVIQADGVRRQLEAARGAYVGGFEEILSADQLARLDFLRRAEKAVPVLPAFRLAGLLPPIFSRVD